ncbi:MAG TPA: hypothetical protein VLV45_11075 [Gemmatimonadales bacterium]|nr:hypothetical protein [Gemmatimonadales bacterium]
MPPVSAERLVKELEKLHTEMKEGKLKSGDYDQRLARIVRELRDQGIAADRAELLRSLDDALARGLITPSVKDHLGKRFGLL